METEGNNPIKHKLRYNDSYRNTKQIGVQVMIKKEYIELHSMKTVLLFCRIDKTKGLFTLSDYVIALPASYFL